MARQLGTELPAPTAPPAGTEATSILLMGSIPGLQGKAVPRQAHAVAVTAGPPCLPLPSPLPQPPGTVSPAYGSPSHHQGQTFLYWSLSPLPKGKLLSPVTCCPQGPCSS